jgi:bacterioferritin
MASAADFLYDFLNRGIFAIHVPSHFCSGTIKKIIQKSQELAHALELARQIDYLGGNPTVKSKDAEFSADSKTMLEIDLKAEQETIKNYRERIRQAEGAGEFALSEKLRAIIAQEQDHEIDLKDALGLR